MRIIERNYLQELIEDIGTPDIKVITGIRRSGKSELLESFIQYISSYNRNANIVHINFSLIDFESLLDYHKLNAYIEDHYVKDKENFLFVDEIQMCNKFELVINSLHSKQLFDIYVTGSNAFLLSSNLATLFTGRTLELHIYPFSYKEFMKYFELDDAINSFDKYFTIGGMPGSYLYKNDNTQIEYIKGVYETIITRDLIMRNGIRNKNLLLQISNFLMDNISNLTSINNIVKYFLLHNEKASNKTVSSQVKYLCESYLFYEVKRYDIRGRKYLTTDSKYYLVDPIFKYAVLGKKDLNYGRVYENIVAIELLRRGYEIYVGILYKKEIDFVAIKRDEKIYIQVADDISSIETFNREVDPLLKIRDAYPKLLIARTKHSETIYEGIHIYDIGDWLAK
jgi:predicted AAA+ superfamily ATPase